VRQKGTFITGTSWFLILSLWFQVPFASLGAPPHQSPLAYSGPTLDTFLSLALAPNGTSNSTLQVLAGEWDRPEDRQNLMLTIEQLTLKGAKVEQTIALFPDEAPEVEAQVRATFSQLNLGSSEKKVRRYPGGVAAKLKQWMPKMFATEARTRISYAFLVYAVDGMIWASIVFSPHVPASVIARVALIMGGLSAAFILMNPYYRGFIKSWQGWALWEICVLSVGIVLTSYLFGLPYSEVGLPQFHNFAHELAEGATAFGLSAVTEGVWEPSECLRERRRRAHVLQNRPQSELSEEERTELGKIESETDENFLAIYGMGAAVTASKLMQVSPLLLYPAVAAIFATGAVHYRNSLKADVRKLNCAETLLIRGFHLLTAKMR
jgi:hypothetical protein